MSPDVSAAPGWYADPAGDPAERYWDGSAWTEHLQLRAPGTPAAPKFAGPSLDAAGLDHLH